MFKRFFAATVAVFVMLAFAPTAFAQEASETIYIGSAEQLMALATDVNGGDSYAGKTVVMSGDIDISGSEWQPIGTFNNRPFAGVFDGGGHEISGLTISSGNFVALFGYMTGTVQDLTVSGHVSGDERVAGVVAALNGNVTGVTNKVTVTASGSYVGGVAADTFQNYYIADCVNEGYVSNSSDTQSSGKVGGILGRADTGTNGIIERCANLAQIKGYQYIGGIAGGIFGEAQIRYCYNAANLEGNSFGKIYLGGIVGKLQEGTIYSCYNRGNVYDNRSNQSMGHIRALGGVVGCEENHTPGTAISNVYTTGMILINTTGMDISNTGHYIMMTGHISGGNSSTAENTMTYENCYYLEGIMPQAADGHHDQGFFRRDVNGPAIWDTIYTTEVSADQLRSDELLETLGPAFAADIYDINDGYPVLAWQIGANGGAEQFAVRTPVVLGGEAQFELSASKAAEGDTVLVTASAITEGKRIYSLTVTDNAGANVSVARNNDGDLFSFVMPGRAVNIEALLANDVSGGSEHNVTLPDNLDAIWSISAESSYVAGSRHGEGATVFVRVSKDPDALGTKLIGIAISGIDQSDISVLKPGLYSFTMPNRDVSVTVNAEYAPLSVSMQIAGSGATPKALLTLTRAEVLDLSKSNVYYSGWSNELDPLIGRADRALLLSDLLDLAGVTFAAGDTLKLTSVDGMTMYFTYESLYGVQRYYYPDIFNESAIGRSPAEPLFTIVGNVVTRSEGLGDEPAVGDTRNTYRFVYGQTESEFLGHTKIVDRFPKYVTDVSVIKQTVLGDVDLDGSVTMADTILCARSVAGLVSLSTEQRIAADIDNDGYVTIADVIIIARYLDASQLRWPSPNTGWGFRAVNF